MRNLFLCVTLAAAVAATGEVRQALEPLKPGEIVAQGWLKRQLELSACGMGGHLGEIEPDQMEKPYITRDFNPANGARGIVGWCAEMGGEYAFGAAMLAYALGDPALIEKAASRVRTAMSLQEPDGYLGAYRPGDNRQEDYNAWGCHWFYNVMLLEYARTGDKTILDAVHRGLLWFVKNWAGDRKTDYAGPTIIGPASIVYRMTGDGAWLDRAAGLGEHIKENFHELFDPSAAYDMQQPSPNSATALLYDELSRLTRDQQWHAAREVQNRLIAMLADRYPTRVAFGLNALLADEFEAKTVVCMFPGDEIPPEVRSLQAFYSPLTEFIAVPAETDRTRYYLLKDGEMEELKGI